MNVLDQYRSSLKSTEVEEVIELFFYRPLAFVVVKLVYNTSITPNQLTLAGLTFGVAGGITLASGNPAATLLAAILFIIFNILDCSDGQLARLKRNGTSLGRILDGIADYLVSASAYFGLGFGFATQTSNPKLFWGLIIAAVGSNILHAVLVDYYRNRFLDYTQERGGVLTDELDDFRKEYEQLKQKKGKWFEKLLIGIYLKYSAMQGGVTSAKQKQFNVSPTDYYNYNKLLIHLWTYLGPATQWTFLIVCLLLNKIEIYLWGLIVFFNTLAFILFVIQKITDRKTLISTAV